MKNTKLRTRTERMDIFEKSRIKTTLPYLKGKVLDIGCGYNNLIKEYRGLGIGVDIYSWKGVEIIANASELPFKDNSFDTITFLANISHIFALKSLKEANRVLKPDGRVIITGAGKYGGRIAHIFFRKDEKVRKKETEESWMWGKGVSDIDALLRNSGFRLVKRKRFWFFMNNLYMGVKSSEEVRKMMDNVFRT